MGRSWRREGGKWGEAGKEEGGGGSRETMEEERNMEKEEMK